MCLDDGFGSLALVVSVSPPRGLGAMRPTKRWNDTYPRLLGAITLSRVSDICLSLEFQLLADPRYLAL